MTNGTAVTTLKLAALVATPPGVVTWTWPLVAPTGIVKISSLDDSRVNGVGVPFRVTAVAQSRFAPLTVTSIPGVPPPGTRLDSVGGATGWTTMSPASRVSSSGAPSADGHAVGDGPGVPMTSGLTSSPPTFDPDGGPLSTRYM